MNVYIFFWVGIDQVGKDSIISSSIKTHQELLFFVITHRDQTQNQILSEFKKQNNKT